MFKFQVHFPMKRKATLFKIKVLLTGVGCILLFCTVHYSYYTLPPHPHPPETINGNFCLENAAFLSLKDVIRPPKLEMGFTQSLKTLKGGHESLESQVSSLIQEQITQIQGMPCDQPNLQCGHHDNGCGFGCQMHHRIACLMLSYAMQMPLIHTSDHDGWPFIDGWTSVFQPLGSSCVPGNNTIVWKWKAYANRIPYPLAYGIPMDAKLGALIKTISTKPFPWMVGQFTKYVMKLNPNFEERLNSWKTEIGFNSSQGPIVGIQVRLTDKIVEAPDSRYPIDVYMTEAEKYFQEYESSHGLVPNSLPRRVFLASDNSSILAQTIKMYPTWKITGFSSKLSENAGSRKSGLFEIVRDVEILSRADFVVCGFSSNVCRLIYEMQTAQDGQRKDGQRDKRFKSLDYSYNYPILGHHITRDSMRIWKIDC